MFGRKRKKAWVVAADMGYGHLRAALPFRDIAEGGKIVAANNYPGIPEQDLRTWEDSRRFYETVSRFKRFPMLGDFVFSLFDSFQEIKEFYPASESIECPTLQLKQAYRLIKEKKWGKHLVDTLNNHPLPLVTTFFIPAYMAEHWGYRGKIYLVIPDTDVSRAWAPLRPSASKIVYCVSTRRAGLRLARYGVKKQRIVETGFPLPKEFTEKDGARAKKDLRRRLRVLDHKGEYYEQYRALIEHAVGKMKRPSQKRKVHVTFAIGGAGAQGELAEEIMEGMRPMLRGGLAALHMIAGVHKELAASLKKKAGKNAYVHTAANKQRYFQDFSNILRITDILWTKPSELSFYCALGIPLLVAPPIGSQEVFNRRWLLEKGAGIDQLKPALASEWMQDFIGKGVFAKAAMEGFVEIRKDGTENIKKLVCG